MTGSTTAQRFTKWTSSRLWHQIPLVDFLPLPVSLRWQSRYLFPSAFSPRAAWAAASRAMGTRKGEQLT